jgi:molybdate/tungstate transport system substrate-binding protein
MKNPKIISSQNIRGPLGRRGIATTIVVLVVVIILIGAAFGYYALTVKTSTTSVVTTVSGTTVTGTGVVTTISGTPTTVYTTATATASTVTTSCTATPLLLYVSDAYPLELQDLVSNFTASTCIPAVMAQDQGSTADAALIAAGDPASAFLSISKGAIESADLGAEYPGWAVSFASDEMALAYTSASTTSSAAQAVITAYTAASSSNSSSAWYTFFNELTNGSVKVGIGNPDLDPAGFRAWMTLQLAGIEYGNNGAGGSSYQQEFVNNVVTNSVEVNGSSAAALIPALATAQINFLFIYKSDVASNGMSLMQLPNPVNLGIATDNTFYSQATYNTSGGLETGAAIALWLSVPKDSINPTGSVDFVIYTIENYQTVLASFGLSPISPARLYVDANATAPAAITALVTSGTLTNAGTL